MIVYRVLDEVFSTWSNIAVMRALRYSQDGMTGRAIAKTAGMSPRAGLASLTHLEGLGIIKRIRGGRDHIFTLNSSSVLVHKSILPLFESEDEYHVLINNEIIAGLKNACLSVYVFGSVARREETKESDYDVCIVYDGSAVTKKLEESVYELGISLYKRFGISLAPFYISAAEFKKRLESNKSPLQGIAKDGILLWGKELIGREHDKKNAKSIGRKN